MTTKIFDYGMNSEGVGKIDGKIILIPNSIIGEEINFEIVEDHNNYALGKLNTILKESKNRTSPSCPYFFECGGCTLQHMEYLEQLKFKTSLIKKTLKKICNLDVDVESCVSCSFDYNYRNKISFSISGQKIGLLKPNSHEIVEISKCRIANESINIVLRVFKEFLKTQNNHDIKNLVVRVIENQVLVGVVLKNPIDLSTFYTNLSTQLNNVGVYEIINTRKDSVVLAGKVKHLFGIKEIKISTFGLTYSVDLLGFHQTNLDIQNKIYEKVLNFVDLSSRVINGFSGQGLLSAVLAKKVSSVVGIEINKSSHLSAENLKKLNNIKNLKNICGDFFKYIDVELKSANTVILDPTKKGCGKQVMQKIKGVENIIYISCNPIALCKDLNEIKNEYTIEKVIPFDMFPQTTSVETLVKLKKVKEKI